MMTTVSPVSLASRSMPAAETGRSGLYSTARAWLGRIPLAVVQLATRAALAGVFLRAGLLKVQSWESTVQLFRDEYHVPVLPPAMGAAMAATFEIGCSSLILAGLLTRVATLPLLGMIATIQLLVYPQAWSEHLTWASLLLLLLTRGPGALSIDRLVGLEPGDRTSP